MPLPRAKRTLSPVRSPLLRSLSSSGPSTPGRGTLDSLKRSLSFHRKNVRPSNHLEDDEVNIFLSDMVTKEYGQEKLAEVKNAPGIVKMEIEDLLVSRHSDLIPIIKSLVVGGDRKWEYIRFVDGADMDEFEVWQEKKHNIRKGFEGTIDDKSKYEQVVTFQCTIHMPRGTPHMDAKAVLEAIRKDDMVSIWEFEGALYNFDEEHQPTMLHKFVDAETGDLVSEVVVTITCGWSAELSEGSKTLLDQCIQALRNPQEAPLPSNQQAPLRRAITAHAAPTHIPKRNMRRCISTDDDGRGVLRTASMPMRRRKRIAAADVPRRATTPSKGQEVSPRRPRRVASEVAPRRPRRVASPSPPQRTGMDESRGRGSESSLSTNSDHSARHISDDNSTSVGSQEVWSSSSLQKADHAPRKAAIPGPDFNWAAFAKTTETASDWKAKGRKTPMTPLAA